MFVKKTIELDETLVKKAKKIFDVDTDKAAVNLALRLVSSEDDIIKMHEELAGKLFLDDIFR